MKFVIVIQELCSGTSPISIRCGKYYNASRNVPAGRYHVRALATYTLECDDKFFHRTFTLKHE